MRIFFVLLALFGFLSISTFAQFSNSIYLSTSYDKMAMITKIKGKKDATSLILNGNLKSESLPTFIPMLDSIVSISFRNRAYHFFPDWSDSLPNVRYVLVEGLHYGCPEHWRRRIDEVDSEMLFDVLEEYEGIKQLEFEGMVINGNLKGIDGMENLRELIVKKGCLTGLSEDITDCEKLRSIRILRWEEGFDSLQFDMLSRVGTLERFYYSRAGIVNFEDLYRLRQINTLHLGIHIRNKTEFDINRMPNVRNLIFGVTDASDIPESLNDVEHLEYLEIVLIKNPPVTEADLEAIRKKVKDLKITKVYKVIQYDSNPLFEGRLE